MTGIDFSDVYFGYKRRKGEQFRGLNLSFDARPTLLLGRNGAGKSTLLKLGAGLIRPTKGSITQRGSVSYLPQRFVTVPGINCYEYVAHLSWLAGRPRQEARADAEYWLGQVGLSDFLLQPNAKLSGGQQARLALAVALNSHADTVFLDEPGAALDPLSKKELHELYKLVSNSGHGLVVSSHDPTDINAGFKRVVIIEQGNVRFDDSLIAFTTNDHHDELVRAFQSAMRYQSTNAEDSQSGEKS